MNYYYLATIALLLLSCKTNTQESQIPNTVDKPPSVSQSAAMPDEVVPIVKSEDEWQKELSEEAFYVLRKAGTERAFTSALLSNKEQGLYCCAGCGLPLFASETKFKSGTGWPSFYKPVKSTHIVEDTDYHIGYARTEIRCARCDGHQGHVFKDGPKPTGLRYCINGVALNFVAAK